MYTRSRFWVVYQNLTFLRRICLEMTSSRRIPPLDWAADWGPPSWDLPGNDANLRILDGGIRIFISQNTCRSSYFNHDGIVSIFLLWNSPDGQTNIGKVTFLQLKSVTNLNDKRICVCYLISCHLFPACEHVRTRNFVFYYSSWKNISDTCRKNTVSRNS